MNRGVEERLRQLGIVLPEASEPAARYANTAIVNGLLFVSGKGPGGHPKGKLGREFTTEEGYAFARSAGLEVLAVVKQALGTLDRVKRVVKVQGFVNATPDFEEPQSAERFFRSDAGSLRRKRQPCAFGVRRRFRTGQFADHRGFPFRG
ncbi:MAG TPA: RidA family protein [Paenibacillaceae bacterium]